MTDDRIVFWVVGVPSKRHSPGVKKGPFRSWEHTLAMRDRLRGLDPDGAYTYLAERELEPEPSLTEADVRRIVREEIAAAVRACLR